jgi:hypothetical protein
MTMGCVGQFVAGEYAVKWRLGGGKFEGPLGDKVTLEFVSAS